MSLKRDNSERESSVTLDGSLCTVNVLDVQSGRKMLCERLAGFIIVCERVVDLPKSYPFKRDLYFEVEKAIERSSVTFLLGARKTGKTVCLRQIANNLEDVLYVDAKSNFERDVDRSLFIKKVTDDITEDRKIIYLIDEATYLLFPDKSIAKIASAFSEVDNENTKIVFAGSQSKALDNWGHLAFAGNASFISFDFLSYPEWLRYKGLTDISDRTYRDFIRGTREFYSNFTSTKDYLQGCLDETVISNIKSSEFVYNNDCSDINVDMLLDVLYLSMLTLHNNVNYQTFSKSSYFQDSLAYFFPDEYYQLGDETVWARISDFIGQRYTNLKNMSAAQLKQCLQFLVNCELITTTYVTDNFSVNPYICQTILSPSSEIPKKDKLMEQVNVCIKYPMFYADLVGDVLG